MGRKSASRPPPIVFKSEAHRTLVPQPAQEPVSPRADAERPPLRPVVAPPIQAVRRNGWQQPLRSSQHQAHTRQASRLESVDIEALIAQVAAPANKVLDNLDTSMFRLGVIIQDPRPKGRSR